jgi:hypothetical protein
MKTHRKTWYFLQLGGGFLSLTTGFVLICVLNWGSSVYMAVNLALGVSSVTLCIIGIRLLLIATEDEPPIEVHGIELGSIELNGRYLVAYESETPDGKKQFRLASTQALTPEREAALVRYLALEGFVSSLWPEMKERLQEEVEWAFA